MASDRPGDSFRQRHPILVAHTPGLLGSRGLNSYWSAQTSELALPHRGRRWSCKANCGSRSSLCAQNMSCDSISTLDRKDRLRNVRTRLRALRPPHVRHHVLRKGKRRVGIPESVIVPWTWQTSRTLPSRADAHMWADVSATRLAEVVESGRFEYRKHRMRSQGWTVMFATVGRE